MENLNLQNIPKEPWIDQSVDWVADWSDQDALDLVLSHIGDNLKNENIVLIDGEVNARLITQNIGDYSIEELTDGEKIYYLNYSGRFHGLDSLEYEEFVSKEDSMFPGFYLVGFQIGLDRIHVYYRTYPNGLGGVGRGYLIKRLSEGLVLEEAD